MHAPSLALREELKRNDEKVAKSQYTPGEYYEHHANAATITVLKTGLHQQVI